MGTRWTYGAAPINWCNDDLTDLGDEYEPEDIWRDLRSLNLTGAEMGRKYPRDPVVLRERMGPYGIQLVSAWTTVHFADPAAHARELEAFRQQTQFLQAMGAKVVVTADGSGSVHWDCDGDRAQRVPWTDSQWKAVAEGLRAAGEICREAGLWLVYHPHLGTNVETPSEIGRLLDGTAEDLVALLLDTGHIYAAGGDPLTLLRQYGRRVRHVHLKDVRAEGLQWYRQRGCDFLGAVRRGLFTVPGDGMIDFYPLLNEFRRLDYAGWMVIEAEQDPALAPPLAYMESALKYLARWGGSDE